MVILQRDTGEKNYDKEYYNNYHTDLGPLSYDDSERWMPFFTGIAERLIKDFAPKTVLDAGCAMGYLVSAFRERGVEAYGIDISEYAVSKIPDAIKPFCVVGSISEPLPEELPKHYDLVISIEVLEHLYPEEGGRAIANLCALTDRFVFSSTPDDVTEPTHVNVQQSEYWVELFATNGYFRSISYKADYISNQALLFERKSEALPKAVAEYERALRLSNEMALLSCANHVTGRVYCDTGEGFLPENIIHFKNSMSRFRISESIDLAPATRQVRYDPLEGECCVVRDLKVTLGFDEVDPVPLNGIRINEHVFFNTCDPQFLIPLPDEHCGKLQISAVVLPLSQEELLLLVRQIPVLQEKMEESVRTYESRCGEYESRCGEYESRCGEYESRCGEYESRCGEYESRCAYLQTSCEALSNAFFWKVTKPARMVTGGIKTILRSNRYTGLLYKGLVSLRRNGWRLTWRKVQSRLGHCHGTIEPIVLAPYSAKEIENQKTVSFSKNIKFSILVPLFNTPQKFLNEMIESVGEQTYTNWELCLADGSDAEHGYVGDICRKYAKQDGRVKYKKLAENLGISGNTNACIEMAEGDYFALLDHDDLLHPSALFANMEVICEQGADFIYTDENTFKETPSDAYCPHFKPDYAPDTLRSYNYICHFTVFDKKLLEKNDGAFRKEFDGSQDYDLVLRLTEKAEKIVHIPRILYYWRAHDQSVAQGIGAKTYAIEAAKKAISEHLTRVGLDGCVVDSSISTTYKIQYTIHESPLVSILIPNKDSVKDLKKCIDSIVGRSTYPKYEIIVIENNSLEQKTFEYYDVLSRSQNIRVEKWDKPFNFSALNNFGFQFARGDHILLLNNDTEVITPGWIQEMLMFSQRNDVGAVGAMLYFPDDTVQHAGVIVGIGGVAGHSHKHYKRGCHGYMGRMTIAQNLSAVTAACMMVPRQVFEQVGGMDEKILVAFNDVDFCLRIRQAGYLIVFTPYAELYHHESKSRGYEDTPEKQKRFQGEVELVRNRWKKELEAGDPYYNPSLTLDLEDFSFR